MYYTITILSDLYQINATLAEVREVLHQARSQGFNRAVILSNKKHAKAIEYKTTNNPTDLLSTNNSRARLHLQERRGGSVLLVC